MALPRTVARDRVSVGELDEIVETIRKGYLEEIRVLKRKMEQLEREKGFYDACYMTAFSYLANLKDKSILEGYITHVYEEASMIGELSRGTAPRNIAEEFDGDIDLRNHPAAAADFKKK